jgi:hypothetical protein
MFSSFHLFYSCIWALIRFQERIEYSEIPTSLENPSWNNALMLPLSKSSLLSYPRLTFYFTDEFLKKNTP